MFIDVNGASLFVDIEGAGLVADGKVMRHKPTLLLLHGGPGFDHSMFKPAFSQLADVAQIVYLDHRGNGRSSRGPTAAWNLAQWGDDVRGVCDVLGIEKPIVLGLSFGGFVAQSYATRHSRHPGKLILSSTAARMEFGAVFDAFEKLGGAQARAIAEGFWTNPTPATRAVYIEKCHPLYNTTKKKADADAAARSIRSDPVSQHFNGPGREGTSFDFRASLKNIRCPVLVMAGDRDPITPLPFSEVIVANLRPALTRFEIFAGCGHGVHRDAPTKAFQVMREFITAE